MRRMTIVAIATMLTTASAFAQGVAGTGCCGSNVGGGHVVTIVITNRGNHWITEDQDHGSTDVDHGITDGTAYNHYSLLRTMEDAFDLPHLAHAGDGVVTPMTDLFRVSTH